MIQVNLLTKVDKRLRLTKGEGGGDKLGDRDGHVWCDGHYYI